MLKLSSLKSLNAGMGTAGMSPAGTKFPLSLSPPIPQSSGQPGPGPYHPQREKFLTCISLNLPSFRFKPLPLALNGLISIYSSKNKDFFPPLLLRFKIKCYLNSVSLCLNTAAVLVHPYVSPYSTVSES